MTSPWFSRVGSGRSVLTVKLGEPSTKTDVRSTGRLRLFVKSMTHGALWSADVGVK